MKWLQRIFVLIVAAGVLMAPQTSQVTSYVDGNVLTAAQLNAEFGNLYSTINGLDEDNFLTTTSFPATFLNSAAAGDGLGRDAPTGVLEVNVDGTGIEINADTLRLKDSGVTSAKILNDTIVAGDIATSGVETAEILDGTILTADISDGTILGADISASTTLAVGNGTNSAPAYAFSANTNTGVYDAGNALGFSTLGTNRALISSAGVQANPLGSAATPDFNFIGDADTGMYRVGANQVGFATNGTYRGSFVASGLSLPAGHGVEAGGGGFIQWTVFTGSLGASATTTLSITGSILGATGYGQYNGGSVYYPMGSLGASTRATSTSDMVDWSGGSNNDSDTVEIKNLDTNSTNLYRVVVTYQ